MIYLGKWIVSKTYDSIYPDNVEAFEMVLVPPGKAPGIPVTIVQLLFYLNIKQLSISLGILVISKSTDVTTFFFEAQRIQHENGKKQEIKSQNLDNIIFSLIKNFLTLMKIISQLFKCHQLTVQTVAVMDGEL